MTLDELFVSHKQVEPVSFNTYKPDLPEPIYLNFDRAQRVVTGENTSTWKVGNTEESPYSGKVGYSKTSSTDTVNPTSDYYIRLREFIAKEEGFKSEAYPDGKYFSIGYGFNGPQYKKGDTMTKEEADEELDRQLQTREAKYKKHFGSKWDNLTDNQRIALMSYGYNTGDMNIITGNVNKYLNSGDMTKLRDSLSINTVNGRYNKELDDRRKRERKLFDE